MFLKILLFISLYFLIKKIILKISVKKIQNKIHKEQ